MPRQKKDKPMTEVVTDMVVNELKKAVVSAVRSTIRTAISGAIVHLSVKGVGKAQELYEKTRAKKALKTHDTPKQQLMAETPAEQKPSTGGGEVQRSVESEGSKSSS